MNILDEIIQNKKTELAQRKKQMSISQLEQEPYFLRSGLSLARRIQEQTFGIISEFKRSSPSAGELNNTEDIISYVKQYVDADVAGLSVLTDTKYFGTTMEDFKLIRAAFDVPMLRKDFIIDEYQLFESKAIGADCILLIASVMSADELLHFSIIAKTLGMEVLVEIHSIEELKKVPNGIDIIGVNNRNLDRQQTDLNISRTLIDRLPDDLVKITESGIRTAAEVRELAGLGYHGALIGESIVRSGSPGEVIRSLTEKIVSVC